MEDKKVTIYDVAAECGLSIATVSRYINNKGIVSEKSVAKITAAIDKLGYQPDNAARKLASGQSNTVGLLVQESGLDTEYYQEFLSGVFISLSEEHIDVMLTSYEEDVNKLISKVRLEKKIDGIITPAVRSPENLEIMLKEGIPLVYASKRYAFDTEGHNVYGGFTEYRRKAVELFIERGCRNLLLVDMSERDSKRAKEAFAEYEDRIHMDYYVCTDMNEDTLYKYLYNLYMSEEVGNKPDGIFFAYCQWTSQVYGALMNAGEEIGKDVKLLTTVHSSIKRVRFVPDMSCVFIDARKMGYNAGKKMAQQLRGESMDPKLKNIPYKMILNESL